MIEQEEKEGEADEENDAGENRMNLGMERVDKEGGNHDCNKVFAWTSLKRGSNGAEE